MSFYSLSVPPKTALCICYKDDEDETFQEKVRSKENLGYQTHILKLHTRFNPGKQLDAYFGLEGQSRFDYVYFKEPPRQFTVGENIQGFARQIMIKVCQAVVAQGLLEVDSEGQEMWEMGPEKFCLPGVIVRRPFQADQEMRAETRCVEEICKQVVCAVESKDIAQIKRFCETGNLFETVLCSGVISEQALGDLFIAVMHEYKKNEEEDWGGFVDPDFDKDPKLDEIVYRMLGYAQIPDRALDIALQESTKHGRVRIVCRILSTEQVVPDALGRALTLAAEEGWADVVESLLQAPGASMISERYLIKALASAIAWLPSGGLAAQDICGLLLKTGMISKKSLEDLQKQMAERDDCALAVDFLERAIQRAESVPAIHEYRALSSSSQF